MEEKANVKIKFGERLAFFTGDFSSMGIVNNFFNAWLVYFYTNILGISAGAAAVLVLVVTIVNAVFSPVFGNICDRTRTRWGTYKPFIVILSLPMALFTFLCFVAPNFTSGGKLAYAYVVYLLYCLLSTMYSTAYGSISSVMTTNDHEHSVLGSARELATNVGGLILNLAATSLLLYFSRDSVITAGGFTGMALIVGIFALILLPLSGIFCKERLQPEVQKLDFKNSIGSVLHNGPAMILIVVVFFVNALLTFKATMTAYFCEYYMGNIGYMTGIMTCMFVSPIIAVWFVPTMVEKLGKKKIFMLSGGISAAAGAVILIGKTNLVMSCIASLLLGIVCAICFSTVWAAVSDCADYGKVKTGVYCPGMIIALESFATKVSIAIAQGGASIVLSATGYDAANAIQPTAAMNAIYLTSGIVPLACGIIAAVVAIFYNIEKKA